MESAVATVTATITPNATTRTTADASKAFLRKMGRRAGGSVGWSLSRPTVGYLEAKTTSRCEAENRGVQVVSARVGAFD